MLQNQQKVIKKPVGIFNMNTKLIAMVNDPGSKELDPLNFELVGIVDVDKMLSENKMDVLMNFYQYGHPAKNLKYKPALIQRVVEDNERIIAVFLATKRANPDSDRKLLSIDDLLQYRKDFSIEFKEEWSGMSFSEIKDTYKSTIPL